MIVADIPTKVQFDILRNSLKGIYPKDGTPEAAWYAEFRAQEQRLKDERERSDNVRLGNELAADSQRLFEERLADERQQKLNQAWDGMRRQTTGYHIKPGLVPTDAQRSYARRLLARMPSGNKIKYAGLVAECTDRAKMSNLIDEMKQYAVGG